MQTITLNNGVQMPQLGFGVYQVAEEETERVVTEALEVGYRSIDTASAYGNEKAVGAAIANSGLPRDEVFVTTKLWVQDAGDSANTVRAFETSLERLGLDHVDLYLMHQPFGDVYTQWRAMEQILADGRARAIGVSNMPFDRLLDLTLHNEVVPAVNQVETHPFQAQLALQEQMAELGTKLESWAPFAEGRNNLFTEPTLSMIAGAKGATVGQVVLAWLMQRGVIVIPKTVRRERMAENLAAAELTLSDDDIAAINNLDARTSLFFDHTDPEMVRSLSARRID